MPNTRDNKVAREEDQDPRQRGKMSPVGGKGPTAAATADTEGAFGDAQRGDSERASSASGDSLSEGPMVADNVAKGE